MGRKNSRRNSKKGKSKKDRAKNNESNVSKEQKQQKTSYDEIAEIFLGSNPEENMDDNSGKKQEQDINNNLNSNTNSYENTSQESDAKAAENVSQSDDVKDTAKTTSADNSQCYDDVKAKQQELLNNLKNLNDSLVNITLVRDNIASLRVEILSNIYFARQLRPLIDAVNLISFASANISTVAQNISINPFGEKREIKNALKISYTMNDEIDILLDTLTRRLKLYVAQLNTMDKNCPPFDFHEDS